MHAHTYPTDVYWIGSCRYIIEILAASSYLLNITQANIYQHSLL